MTDTLQDPIRLSADGFVERYGCQPDGVWSAPGRANLIGEHTDYNNGFALPFAIDRRAAVAAGLRSDDRVRVSSSAFSGAVELRLGEIGPGAVSGWSAYPLGVAWALAALVGDGAPLPGVEIFIDSQVPTGSGLSSSAALACAVATALCDLWQIEATRPELGLAVQRAENTIVGAPTGIMDQFASLLAARDRAVLIDCDDRSTELVPLCLDDAGLSILVIDTREQHSHAAGGYAERRSDCELAAGRLGLDSLRELQVSELGHAAELLDDRLLRRVRHIVTENERVLETVRLLSQHGPARIGSQLNRSHQSMRDDFEISTPALDLAVRSAVDNGALGARMTGGGFGGSAIALVEAEGLNDVAGAIAEAFERVDAGRPELFAVTPSQGARRDR
jgi:galactokinase